MALSTILYEALQVSGTVSEHVTLNLPNQTKTNNAPISELKTAVATVTNYCKGHLE